MMLFSRKITASLNVVLSQLVKLVLSAHISQRTLAIIFQETSSLRHLITHGYFVLNHLKSIDNREMMCRIRTLALEEELWQESDVLWLCEAFQHVECLSVNVSTIKFMRTICSRLQFSLTTVHFLRSCIANNEVKLEKTKVNLLKWLHKQQWNFTFHTENALISFWLSNRKMKGWWNKKRRFSLPSNEQRPKRVKLTDDITSVNDQDVDKHTELSLHETFFP